MEIKCIWNESLIKNFQRLTCDFKASGSHHSVAEAFFASRDNLQIIFQQQSHHCPLEFAFGLRENLFFLYSFYDVAIRDVSLTHSLD